MLRNTHEAEDATQQSFLSAHRALLGGAQVRDEGAWIATIARNECRARIVAGMRLPLTLGEDDLLAIPAPNDELERRVQAKALRNALGLSRPAVEALLFRARRALRQRLRPLVTTTLGVPIAVQEVLAQAIPGFSAGGSGAVVAGAAGGGLLAKLTAGPVAVKFATAAVAVTTLGTLGTVESEKTGRDWTARSPAVVTAAPDGDDGGSSGRHGGRNAERAGDDSSGRGGDDGSSDRDNSGSGEAGSASSGKGGDEPSSGPSSREPGEGDSSGAGGSGSSDELTVKDASSSGPGPGSEPEAEDSSGGGPGRSGSELTRSGGRDSSGEGSSDESDD